MSKRGIISVFFLFSILLSFTNCTNKKTVKSKNKLVVTKIKVNYEDMFTTTPYSITCSLFDSVFKKVIKHKTILNLDEITKFKYFFDQTLKNNIRIKNIDVRIKVKMYYSNKTIQRVCLGLHSLELDGIRYSISKEFMEYLLILTETE